jgi:hypothetical protein
MSRQPGLSKGYNEYGDAEANAVRVEISNWMFGIEYHVTLSIVGHFLPMKVTTLCLRMLIIQRWEQDNADQRPRSGTLDLRDL